MGGESVLATSAVRKVTSLELLSIREEQWSALLRKVSLVAEAEIAEERRTQVASALGHVYARARHSGEAGIRILAQWPACLVAAMTGVAITGYEQGTYWPALWKATDYHGGANDQHVWGEAFTRAAARLNLPTFPNSRLRYLGPVLMHAGIPVYCLGDFFRLLVERRRQDPVLEADAFLAWATEPGRALRLSELDTPAQRFLLGGGDYAHDVVDRTLDLLERLGEPDPDFDGVRLPAYMIQAARKEIASGRLDLSLSRRSHARGGPVRQARPRIALDPYGQGVQVVLPAVGDMPDGVAHWRVTADGETRTVQSRALWVGAAEAAPQTTFALNRPVRTVLVSLAGREELAAELRVVEPTDPVMFFGEDGRRLASGVSLPRGRVWVMHPADSELVVVGNACHIAEPAVPFGWDGWSLRLVSLDDAQAVSLVDGPSHPVEQQARPRLLLGEPVPGVTTPYGSPVYAVPPRLVLLGGADSPISWHVEVRRAADGASLVRRSAEGPDELDIWEAIPRPALGSFEVTVRGPLGRGMRRTIFLAEGLAVSYQPQVRGLTGGGLAGCDASLSAKVPAAVFPGLLHFGSAERALPIEYRTATETEPLVVTPPHVAMMCPGAGITTWAASPLRLVTETFADAGRLLVHVPTLRQASDAEMQVQVSGTLVQTIPPSGQQSPGLAGFELVRAADTVAAHGRAELVFRLHGISMPIASIRPRRLATGIDLADDTLVLRDPARVDGLTAGVYLVYAPWRPPAELTVSPDGVAILPDQLMNAGPLHVLLRVDDPWTVSSWPVWPGTAAYVCEASGIPASADPVEEGLSRFVAGDAELPCVIDHLAWLWRVVDLSAELVRSGARPNLSAYCADELRQHPRAALLAMLYAGLDHATCVRALISTGMAAVAPEPAPWTPAELTLLSQLWAALPAAAAIATGDLVMRPDLRETAVVQCGGSLSAILDGRPDPHAAVGRFGPDAERMALLPHEQVEAIWQAAAVVPQAMLDADTRATAARRMFDARRESPIRAAATSANPVIHFAYRLTRESRYPLLSEELAARRPAEGRKGWLAIPAMSIGLALAARLEARGDKASRSLELAYRGKWSNLALCAPELVAIDLVLAEALVVGAMAKESHG